MNSITRPTYSTYSDRDLVSNVTVRLVSHQEISRWNKLVSAYHYLGFHGMVGERLRYVAVVDEQWIALLGWHTAALKCGVRDRWIGWHPEVRYGRLRLIANNTRYLLLPERRVPNLASRILSLTLRRLSADWTLIYGHPVVLAETFVDMRFHGTCYRAANWLDLGSSRGYRKTGNGYQWHGSEKHVLVHPLAKDARSLLRDPTRHGELSTTKGVRTMNATALGSLYEQLKRLPDPRKARGKRHRATCIFAIIIGALLCGARSYLAVMEWGRDLSQAHLRRVGARYNPKTKRYEAPSEATIRRMMYAADPERVDRLVSEWLSSQTADAGVAVDGKTMRNARGDDGKQVHLLSAFLHEEGVVVAQRQVDNKTNEITQVEPLLKNVDLTGKVLTADAMHTQKTTARFLVQEKQADFVFIVKENQKTLYDDIKSLGDEAFSPWGEDD